MQDKNISKDFIKFRQHIRSLDLSVNEQYLLELLFEYHNIEYGYAFPKFQHLLEAFNTSSKNRISSTIKKLEKKGLIKVQRTFLNNRYYIIGIENFINSDKPKQKPKDSNGNPPLNGQVHITELEEITEDEKQLMELSKMTHKQAKSLLEMSKNKTTNILDYVRYALRRRISNVYAYVRKLIKVDADVSKFMNESEEENSNINPRSFHNFESRQYDYKDLEWQLLGWESD